MTKQELQALQDFAQWLREKNDRTQEELERQEGPDDE